MKPLGILFYFVFYSAVLVATACCASDSGDHLVPLEAQNSQFRHVLESKLLVTPFTHGRVFVRPPFDGESSVSIYCQAGPDRKHHCYVTYITAKENLYQRTDGGNRPKKAKFVKIDRIDAEIPEHIADNVREVWWLMLKRTSRYDSSSERWVRVPVDATIIEFALRPARQSMVQGEINLFAPTVGEETKDLIDVVDLLVRYCKAPPSTRSAIGAKISSKARRLANVLGKP